MNQHRLSLAHDELGERLTDKESQCSVGYASSPLDSLVPSPRLSGGRFNQNGFLCLFGQTECLFHLVTNNRDEKISDERRGTQILRPSINKNMASKRMSTPQEEAQKAAHKKAARFMFNRHEPQPASMRTLSDYHSFG